MSVSTATRPSIIALSLAVGFALTPATPAHADDLGQIATASVLWDSADSTTGVFTGGTPQIFDPAFGGWRGPAFDRIGEFGLEITPGSFPTERKSFSAWNEASTIEQGGTSSLSLSAQIISDSVTRNLAEPVIRASANSLRYDIHIEQVWPDSLLERRVFFFADLAAGSSIRYEAIGPTTLLATDDAGEHPAVLLHLSSTTGTAYWASRSDHQQALADGDPLATAYVADIPPTGVDLSVHAVVIDGDPCAAEQMRQIGIDIAADLSASFGSVLEVPSGCLAGNTWSALTDSAEPQQLSIVVDERVSTPDGATRRFVLGGHPPYLQTTIDESRTPAAVSLEVSDQAVAGDIPLTLTSWLESGSSRSQPMTRLVTLALSEPEPEPEPEPLPEIPVEPTTQEVTAVSTASTSASGERRRDRDDEVLSASPSPQPPTTPLPPRSTAPREEKEETAHTESGDPQYRLQESTPATPLPAPPQPEQARGGSHEPATNLWSTWWLWVIVGLALLWWAWLGWYSRRGRAEGM